MSDVANYPLAQSHGGANSLLGDVQLKLQQLIHCEAHHFAPVRFRVLESMLRKAAEKPEPVAHSLSLRIKQRLAQYEADWAKANEQGAVTQSSALQPAAAKQERSQLSALLDQIARRAMSQAEPEVPNTFEGLLRKQEVDALKQMENEAAAADLDALLPAGELKALQQMREAWARRSTEKAVAKALEEAPEDAGPLNSHRLVVRSLMAMQDIAPDYLGRFVNQIETLLWLEQAGAKLLAKDEKNADGKSKSPSGRRR